MTIKANQPGLLAAAHHALSNPGAEHTEHTRGHGRTGEGILPALPVATTAPIDFPRAAQIFRVIRYGVLLRHSRRDAVGQELRGMARRAGLPG